MSLQRIQGTFRAGRVSFRGCDPREMLPCRSKVRPQPRRAFECGDRLGPAVANEGTAVEELVTQLEPSQEESRVALSHGAQRVESCVQGQLCGANQTGVLTRQRIRQRQIQQLGSVATAFLYAAYASSHSASPTSCSASRN